MKRNTLFVVNNGRRTTCGRTDYIRVRSLLFLHVLLEVCGMVASIIAFEAAEAIGLRVALSVPAELGIGSRAITAVPANEGPLITVRLHMPFEIVDECGTKCALGACERLLSSVHRAMAVRDR